MNTKDLAYLAQFENSIGRSEKAIDMLEQLAQVDPHFDQVERQLLVLIFKTAVDPVRETIRTLRDMKKELVEAQKANQVQLVEDNIQNSLKQLNSLCQKGLDLVTDVLIPPCNDVEAKAFYEKLNGDLYRYKAEFATGEDLVNIKKLANEAYSRALTTAQQLSVANPTRLGVILNFAVFKYEHADAKEEAKQMVSNAIKEYYPEFEQLSAHSQAETRSVIEVMQKNLYSWTPKSYSEVEEEDAGQEEDEAPQAQ